MRIIKKLPFLVIMIVMVFLEVLYCMIVFKAIPYENFINYIPHRHYEGFGLSKKAVDKLKSEGVALIITVDCGTTDNDSVSYAQSVGVDVIITDHHEPGESLPAAIAVVNPKLGNYPFTELLWCCSSLQTRSSTVKKH